MITLTIEMIREYFTNNKILYSKHAIVEMKNEELGTIKDHEINEAILNGEIIKEYPDDKPYMSFLIFGKTINLRPLHIVCSVNTDDGLIIIITVYQPNPDLWIDYKKHRS